MTGNGVNVVIVTMFK